MKIGRCYQMETGDVVRVVGANDREVTLQNQRDGTTWTVRREPFVEDIGEGYIQRVEPASWTVVSDA